MKMPQQRFTSDMKMADILDANPDVGVILLRLGIGFGFGEKSVREVCLAHGTDAGTFTMICNVCTFDGYRPSPAELSEGHVLDVVRYLRQSHTYYSEGALVRLEQSIRDLIVPCQEKLRNVIWTFFDGYRTELLKHFSYEEETVFPYIQKIVLGGEDASFSIDGYKENHEVVDEKLGDLRNLVMKTLPAECDAGQRFSLLSFLYFLQRDLGCHTRVENEVMVPMVRYIEKPQTFVRTSPAAGDISRELSDREKEILLSVASGMLNKEIADKYNISIHTVISHRKNITRKTGIKTVAGLTVYALLNGLLDAETV